MEIVQKIMNGNRITPEEALSLYRNADLIVLGQLANFIRKAKHPSNEVTYIVDRNINYTNICNSGCKFCAFYKKRGDEQGYILEQEELYKKIQETIDLGGKQIMLQGGHNPDLGIEYYRQLLSKIKDRFPNLWIHGFSPPEIMHIVKTSGLTISETLVKLQNSGLDSIPGGGAEILVDRVRAAVSPAKCRADQWLEVMETAHNQGLRTTATMMYGHVETEEERIEHMRKLRDLQDRTKGFTAFIPWPFQPSNTRLDHADNDGFTYLKTLALSRIFLDNFDNIQASWVTQGSKIAQMALFFGANDMGSTMIEENVVKAAGVEFRLSEQQIREIIEGAGFSAMQRNMLYHRNIEVSQVS